MRSRYSAFVLERAPYLLATWHASHRPASIEFESGVKWLGLEVRDVLPPTARASRFKPKWNSWPGRSLPEAALYACMSAAALCAKADGGFIWMEIWAKSSCSP